MKKNLHHTILPNGQWQFLAQEHSKKVTQLTHKFLAGRNTKQTHPIEDFLFTYYRFSPGKLQNWHPGNGKVLVGKETEKYLSWPFYRTLSGAEKKDLKIQTTELAVTANTEQFFEKHETMFSGTIKLLQATKNNAGFFGCFGLHEWAMVYKQNSSQLRHLSLPLRLGETNTNKVVENNKIRCSHYDAYRFFTKEAKNLNILQPERVSKTTFEQPACLHTNMDLYKLAYRLVPIVSSELVLQCFNLAKKIRILDMQASPYDLRSFGYLPVKIETTEGKTEYAKQQRHFSELAASLREKLLLFLEENVN